MKRCVAFSCGALTLLGLSASAFADDAPAGAGLQAGGLKPPDAVPSDASAAAPSPTEASLDLADKEDSGRGLEFVWLNAELGPEYLGLQTLRNKGLVDSQQIHSKDLGMVYGAGLGMRLLVFTFGARFRFGDFPDWQLWTLNAEAGMHIPIGRIEPYLTLGGGYASLGAWNKSKVGADMKQAHGLDVRAGAGVDFYLTNTFSIGGNLTGDMLVLSRSGSSSALGPEVFSSPSGSGIGLGGTLSAVLGLHF
ncbi:MAG TPA: hypothetical protein VGF76_23370 [Polyangiaceae bacterium]|jgi:hypothetical protein